MQIEPIIFGTYWVIKDNQNELQYLLRRDNLFIQKHDSDEILISDSIKNSVKDAIKIKASELTKIEGRPLVNPSQAIAMVYLARLLNITGLDVDQSVDGYVLVKSDGVTFTPDVVSFIDNPSHLFNSNDAASVSWTLGATPSEDITFRITNGGLESMTLVGNYGGNNFIVKDGINATQQTILAGETVEVFYNFSDGYYTLIVI